MVLLVGVARVIGLEGHHIHSGNRRSGGTVGDTSAHGTGSMGKTYIRYLILQHRAVGTLVLHGNTVVVIDAGLWRFVGEEQVLIRTGHAVDGGPGIRRMLSQTAVNYIGLGGIGFLLLVDLPCELDHTGIYTLLGFKVDEERSLTDALLGSCHFAELDILYPAFHTVVTGLAAVERLFGIGHTCQGIHAALTLGMLRGGAVLPYVRGLVVTGNDGIDRLRLIVDKDLERMPEILRITV